MFGWTTFLHGESLKEEDWWETTTPVKALRNMRERQEEQERWKDINHHYEGHKHHHGHK